MNLASRMSDTLRIAILTTDDRSLSSRWHGDAPTFGAAPLALLQGFEQLKDVEVHVIYCLREKMATREDFMSGIHFHQVVVPKWGWMSSGYLGCIAAVRKCLAEIRPDIVHGQGTERDCAMEAVHSGFPNVLTIHGNMGEIQRLGYHGHALFGRLAAILEKHALRRSAGIFCNSGYTRDLVRPGASRTWLVPNPIREVFFAPRTGVKKPNGVPQLLNVGLISPRKRQLDLLRAAGDLVRNGHLLHLVFVGGLPEHTDYGKEFARELEIAASAGYAPYPGFLGAADLIELMDRSDGFVHFPTEEAFGLVVAEAMARGLKFFGANLGGIVEIARGIDGAELHDDVESLKTGLVCWLDAGAPAPKLTADEIARRYHPRVIADRHVKIYREVLGS